MTSPLALVPSDHQVVIEIELLMNLTLPSANPTLQPPGWRLLAFSYWPSETGPPVLSGRQPDHGFCVELGVTIVLKREWPVMGEAQRQPLSSWAGAFCLVVHIMAHFWMPARMYDWRAQASNAW